MIVEEDFDEYENALAELEEESKPKIKKKQKSAMVEEGKLIDLEDRERTLIAQLLNNSDLFIKGITFLEKDFFESKINKLIISFIKEYYEAYKSIPPEDAILLELGIDGARSNWLDIKKQWPHAYLEDYLNAFIKNMSMKAAIEDSIELLADEDYGQIEKKIKDAVNVDLDVKLGVTINANKDSYRDLFDMLTSNEMTIPSGWSNVDEKLEGGVTVPSLNYILAKSGGGKCLFFDNKINIKMSKLLYAKIKNL